MKKSEDTSTTQDTVEFPVEQTGEPHLQKAMKKLQVKVRQLEDENARLRQRIDKLRVQTRQLDDRVFDLYTISQAGKVFTATPNIKRLSEILLSMLTERLKIKKTALLLYDEKTDNFWVSHSTGLDEEDLVDVNYHPKEGLFWQLIVNGEPFSVVDIEGNLRFSSVFNGSHLKKLESTVWIPMKTREHVIGIITIGENELLHSDMDFATQLAGQAAVAFETAFLYKAIDESRKELDRQMHNLSILYEIGKAMNYIEDLTKLLVQILDQAIDVVNASKGSLMLLENGELIVRVVRGIDKITEEKIINGEIQCTRIKLGQGIAGRVALSGEPLLIEDTSTDDRFLVSRHSNVRNIMCVPLRVYEETIGVINMSNKKEGKTFTQEDLRIITTLADQAAVAINNARLYEMAVTDSLTKLFIRRHFMQNLASELRRAMRYGHQLSLLMMDLDHFKPLNDTYGHQAGDLVLVEIAKIFRRNIRATDMAARYGGEEFCIMLPETNTTGALVIAERLRKEVESMTLNFQDQEINTTISIGIATFSRDARDSKQLIRKADLALYRAKEEGRNRTIPFSLPEEEEEPPVLQQKEPKFNELPDVQAIPVDAEEGV